MPQINTTKDHYINVMLDKYVEWLNMWRDADDFDDPTRYTKEDFIHPEWNSPEYVTDFEWEGDFILVLSVYDGDDGGRHGLMGRFYDSPEAPLLSLVQHFDTYMTMVWEDNHFMNTPTPQENT